MGLQSTDRPVSPAALAAFRRAKSSIIDGVVAASLARTEDVAHHGERAEELIRSGIRFTTQMLETAMSMGGVTLLEDQLVWAQDRLPHDGVSMQNVLQRFHIYCDVVEELLPAEHAREILPYLRWMMAHQQAMMEARGE